MNGMLTALLMSQESSVDILDGWGTIPGRDKIFASPYCPDHLWGPPSLLSDGYWRLLPGGEVVGA
jgi:hypothetical protein